MHLLQRAGNDPSPACEPEVVFLCTAQKRQVSPLRFSSVTSLKEGVGKVGEAKKLWFTTSLWVGVLVDLGKLPALQAMTEHHALSSAVAARLWYPVRSGRGLAETEESHRCIFEKEVSVTCVATNKFIYLMIKEHTGNLLVGGGGGRRGSTDAFTTCLESSYFLLLLVVNSCQERWYVCVDGKYGITAL